MSLSSTLPTVLWMTVYVPGASCGKRTYTLNLQLTPQGGSAISVPVSLYVFDFVLDITSHVDFNGESQPLFSGCCYTLAQLDAMKTVYLQHRMSGGPAWPNGKEKGKE